MNFEIREACIAVVQQAAEPMTVSQIRAAVSQRYKAESKKRPGKDFNQQLLTVLDALPEDSETQEWPKRGSSRLFWNRSFQTWVEEALLKALDAEPLTAKDAAKAVAKCMRRVPAKPVLVECTTLLRQLAESKSILQLAPTRQIVMYVSFTYLESVIPARTPESPLPDLILSTVERLQTRPGNYVAVGFLRNAPELLKLLDDVAVELAAKNKLVLGRYDGPRPVPDENKSDYIEDAGGELFIGVALPRSEEALA